MMNSSEMIVARKEYLRRLLCPFWLRPESALWYAHEAYLARQYIGPHIRQPSLEFGCMEGVSTFVMLGGEFNPAFDVYSEVTWCRDSISWKSLDDDYYNTTNPGQVEEIDAKVLPDERFEIGLSWKHAHLNKAAKLGIHKRLIEHDPNTPLTMFESQSFATIWAPNLYWVDNLNGAVQELRRVLSNDGRLITALPDTSAPELMVYRFVDQADAEWIKDLDRGRHLNTSRQARSVDEWELFFASQDLRIVRHEMFLPKIVFQVNDIGFRPMFPVFMNIYETLKRQSFSDWHNIKEHWIDTAFHYLAPLCDVEWMEQAGMKKVWHIFELQPTPS